MSYVPTTTTGHRTLARKKADRIVVEARSVFLEATAARVAAEEYAEWAEATRGAYIHTGDPQTLANYRDRKAKAETNAAEATRLFATLDAMLTRADALYASLNG
jgi:hypothetical protein